MKLQHKKLNRKPRLITMGVLLVGIGVGGSYIMSNTTHSPQGSHKAASQDQPIAQNNLASSIQTPVRMEIEKISVNAAIKPVGLTPDGAMDAPKTNDYIGWYNKSAKVGESNMSILLDGHYGTKQNPAVFFRLSELVNGDTVVLHGEGGLKKTYQVTKIETLPLEKVNMKGALYPPTKNTETLTIIPCDGEYDESRNTYNDRTVLYAKLKK